MCLNSDEVMTLVIAPALHVAGEELGGEIHLNFQRLQKTPLEEVHVKLRGSVFTQITAQEGGMTSSASGKVELFRTNMTSTARKRVELVREDILLWRKGSAYPSSGEHVLNLPFRFILPTDLLPSFHYHAFGRTGTVAYSVEAVGIRSGLLHARCRILQPIPIMPYSLSGATLRSTLKLGWMGISRVVSGDKNIRRGIWGDYAKVNATIRLPDIQQIPVFAPVPIAINIITISKPMRREDTGSRIETIFPAPPSTSSAIELKLVRRVVVKTDPWSDDGIENVGMLGGFGMSDLQAQTSMTVPHIDVTEKVWIPESRTHKKTNAKEEKGIWKQEVTFTSTFEIICSPSFESLTLTNSYCLVLKVPFPGIGNGIKVELPITVISSMLPPESDVAWDGPPPELDLPPAYMGATDWDHDGKCDDWPQGSTGSNLRQGEED